MRQTQSILFAAAALLVVVLIGQNFVRSQPPAATNGSLPRYKPSPEDLKKAYDRSGQFGGGGRRGAPAGTYKSQITPHWFANNTRFWYRNDLKGGTREFIVVDAKEGTRGGLIAGVRRRAESGQAAVRHDRVRRRREGRQIHGRWERLDVQPDELRLLQSR